MAKLTITLRQDTPMWHFLPDETGCCLRATEVKPKLDKFLKTKPGYKSEWQIKDKDQKALDYKMTFVPNSDNECDKKDKYPTFFGNGKKAIYYKNGITMTIFSLNSELVEKIKDHICEFFACHSFGTRQSKGFGCFYPEEIKCDDKTYKIPCFCDVIKNVAKYKFTTEDLVVKKIEIKTKTVEVSVFEQLFDYINYFHKLIRSGINDPKTKTYYKSLMYFYAQKKDMTWDKPQIRHYFGLKSEKGKPLRTNYLKKCGKPAGSSDSNCTRTSMKNEYNHFGEDEPYKFTYINGNKIPLFRDALGLSSSQSWMYYSAKLEIKDSNNNKKEKVERFKSPLLYRPVKNVNGSYTVYIIINQDDDVFKRLKQATFKIEGFHSIPNPQGSPPRITLEPLKARIYDGFNIFDYLEFVYDLIVCCREKGLEIKDIYKIFAQNKKIDEPKEKISECNNKPQQTSENNQQKDNDIDNIIAQIKGSFEKIEQKP